DPAQHCKRLQAVAFLVKPVNFASLYNTVDRLLLVPGQDSTEPTAATASKRSGGCSVCATGRKDYFLIVLLGAFAPPSSGPFCGIWANSNWSACPRSSSLYFGFE